MAITINTDAAKVDLRSYENEALSPIAYTTSQGGLWERWPHIENFILLERDLDSLLANDSPLYIPSTNIRVSSLLVENGAIWDADRGWRVQSDSRIDANKVLIKQFLADPNVIKPENLNKGSILQEAQDIIYGDREQTYGHPAKNINNIAAQWSLYLQQRYGIAIPISGEDVCWMMADLKKARQMNASKRDNLVDAAGYLALIDRINE